MNFVDCLRFLFFSRTPDEPPATAAQRPVRPVFGSLANNSFSLDSSSTRVTVVGAPSAAARIEQVQTDTLRVLGLAICGIPDVAPSATAACKGDVSTPNKDLGQGGGAATAGRGIFGSSVSSSPVFTSPTESGASQAFTASFVPTGMGLFPIPPAAGGVAFVHASPFVPGIYTYTFMHIFFQYCFFRSPLRHHQLIYALFLPGSFVNRFSFGGEAAVVQSSSRHGK